MIEKTTYISPTESISSNDGKIRWDQGRGIIRTNSTTVAVTPPDQGGEAGDIQKAIDLVESQGGGVVSLRVGEYFEDADIIIPANVTLQGEISDGVIIDFQGGAHQVRAEGTNAYTTGTISATNGSTTVTGSGTFWNSGMIGQYIIISGVYFAITAVGSTTSLTIEAPFDSPSVTGQSYVIADTISGVTVQTLSIANSTATTGALFYKYVNSASIIGVSIYDSTIGFNFLDSSSVSARAFYAFGCGTGIKVDNGGVWTFNDFGAFSSTGDNMNINRLISASVSNATFSSGGTNGITVTNSSNWGLYDMTVTTNTGKGIEISNSSGIQIFSMAVQNNGSDGIKLTTNADRIVMNAVYCSNNVGYGINIANANCDKNTITSSNTVSNTAGTINNAGTGTLQANNQT